MDYIVTKIIKGRKVYLTLFGTWDTDKNNATIYDDKEYAEETAAINNGTVEEYTEKE